MRFYEATSTIAAAPDAVWPVLVDGAAWPQWDSGVDGVEGRMALDQKIKIRSQAVRTYSLAPDGTGGTMFHMREEYTGPLLGLIWRSMPDLGPSFRQFAEGLKKRVESGG